MICLLSQTATLLRLLPADASAASRASVAAALEKLPLDLPMRREPVDRVLRVARGLRMGSLAGVVELAGDLEDEAAAGVLWAWWEPVRRAHVG